MTTPLRIAILDFIAELRTAGVRISVAESIDAMNAVSAAGIRRARMREALRAALIKDEADGATFEAAFARRFSAARPMGAPRRSEGARMGVSGSGRGGGSGAPPVRRPEEEATAAAGTRKAEPAREIRGARPAAARRDEARGGEESERGEGAACAAEAEVVGEAVAGSRFGRDALIHRIAGIPFADYSDLEYH
ncbi:MAG TPA: hypothetical protein VEF07_07310, partial [Candidatus Binataceae bacterium]|nr:hypothetical protein [Candidatus Binataceae bacterium]